MADETKTFLLKVESNLKELGDSAIDTKKKIQELKDANDLLTKSGQKGSAEYEVNIAKQKLLQKEYNQTLRSIGVLTSANKSDATARDKLNAIITIETQKLKALGDGYITNANGLKAINPLYVQAKKNVADANLALIDYDQSLNSGKTNIGRYGESVKSAFASVGKSILAIAGPAAAATYALNGLKEAFAGTERGTKFLAGAKLQMKAFFDAIVEGRWRYAFGNELPKDIQKVSDLMDKVRVEERAELVAISEKELDIKNLRIDAIKAGKDSVEQVKLLTKAEEKENELIQIRLNHKGQELTYINMILAKDPQNTDALNKQAQLQAEINDIMGDRSLRIASKLEAAQEKTLSNAKKLSDVEIKNRHDQDVLANKEAQDFVDAELKRMKEVSDAKRKNNADAEKENQDFIDRTLAEWDKRDLINEANRLKTLELINADEFAIKRANLKLQYDAEIENAKKTGADIEIINTNYALAQRQINKLELDYKLDLVASFTNALGDLLGQQTAIGKAAAIATATMDTYVAAQKAYKTNMDIPPAPVWGVIAAAAAIVAGLSRVRQIMAVSTNVKSGSSSGPSSSSGGTSMTMQRNFAPQTGSTVLTQPQLTQPQLNAIQSSGSLSADDIAKALKNLPAPVVTVEDINAKTKAVNKIVVRSNI